jgi:hypothetical protein
LEGSFGRGQGGRKKFDMFLDYVGCDSKKQQCRVGILHVKIAVKRS